MRKIVLWGIIILIIVCTGYVVYVSIGQPDRDILEIGTFIVLSLTLVALVFYANDTNLLASVGQSKWERENILSATYQMTGIDDRGGVGRILFRINNPSTLIIKAKVWCDFKIYGSPVKSDNNFNGKNTWILFPQQMSQGWFEISSLLEQQGKSVQQMIDEYTPGNMSTQLTLDLTIEFRDELGNERRLPTRKHFFEFNEWRWIPVLTEESAGWGK